MSPPLDQPYSTAKKSAGSSVIQDTRALYRDLQLTIEFMPIDSLTAYRRSLRTHAPEHIDELQASIEAYGLVNPILIDADGEIVAGHGILEAARRAGYTEVRVLRLTHLDELQTRTLRIALNRLAERSRWNLDALAEEFRELHVFDLALDLNFDLTITGFAAPEIDQLIESRPEEKASGDGDDALPADLVGPPVSQLGDLWILEGHRLFCGDARNETTYASLLGNERAAMGIHDAPYDVKISGHVAKRGRHREFVMGSGELGAAFTPFLSDFLAASTAYLVPGGYKFCFMDWRHMGEMQIAGQAAGLELKNVCVWNKGVGGMGSLYRSQHELVFVFKDRRAPGANNVQLGRYKRNRTNVWSYPGAVSLRKELELHPTPKNVRMVADAIRDVTRRNDIVLDAFSGSGTTIIACAKVGRRAYAVELDPYYVDVGVRRWQQWSGKLAHHAETGLTFDEVAERRRSAPDRHIALGQATDPGPAVRIRQRSQRSA